MPPTHNVNWQAWGGAPSATSASRALYNTPRWTRTARRIMAAPVHRVAACCIGANGVPHLGNVLLGLESKHPVKIPSGVKGRRKEPDRVVQKADLHHGDLGVELPGHAVLETAAALKRVLHPSDVLRGQDRRQHTRANAAAEHASPRQLQAKLAKHKPCGNHPMYA